MTIAHPRIGMDVEIRDRPGRWLLVAFGPGLRTCRVAALDWPGGCEWVSASELREAWPPAYINPIEKL